MAVIVAMAALNYQSLSSAPAIPPSAKTIPRNTQPRRLRLVAVGVGVDSTGAVAIATHACE